MFWAKLLEIVQLWGGGMKSPSARLEVKAAQAVCIQIALTCSTSNRELSKIANEDGSMQQNKPSTFSKCSPL